jgi:hypothetical protein
MQVISYVPRKYLIVGLVGVFFSLILIGVIYLFSRENQGSTSEIKGLTNPNLEGAVGGEGTPYYNHLIDDENALKAQEARDRGNSFVAVPIGEGRSTAPKLSPLQKNGTPPPTSQLTPKVPPTTPIPVAPERKPREKTPPKTPETDEYRAILGNLKKVESTQGVAPTVLYTAAPEEVEPLRDTASLGSYFLSPGDLLYAVTDLALNSDYPSPVIATIVQGQFKGAKVLGSFKSSGDSLILSFSKIISPEGMEIPIEAVGIDPDTTLTSLKSDVDTHFLSRWGSLLAASFIEGFGQAVSTRNTRVYTVGDTVVQDDFGKTYRDITLEAIGKVGGRAATQVERGFDRAPTVTVAPGKAVGILIIKTD